MSRGIYYVFSVLVSIVVLIFLMRFFNVGFDDITYFIEHGIGGALKILVELRNAIVGTM